ncbi:MAG: hypothetical protein EOP48_00310 [Sphingobacteriales bacterium]|nr:MAG: hypothetical protein EOP48_00310 [Sphingobacteriales bacterium]
MEISDVRPYVAIVNAGSGCLIKPMTDQYIYLLTAKHNIEDAGNVLERISLFSLAGGAWARYEIEFPSFQEGLDYFPHPTKDIAIIKIMGDYPVHNDLYRDDRFSESPNGFNLLGYPEIRRNNAIEAEWYRLDNNVSVLDDRGEGMFEAMIPGNPGFDEVSGTSGGAIVKIIKGKAFLAGIQNRMAEDEEVLGRIRFTGISAFEEIVALFPVELTVIFPAHLKSFSFLHNECFNLHASINTGHIEYTKNFLKHKASEVVASPLTPIGIKRLFEQRLLIFNQPPSSLHDKTIWILWLEFLTILNIMLENEYSEEAVKEIFNHTRFIFSSTDKDWCEELSNIVYSDYKGLKKGGAVVIGVSHPPFDEETYVLEKGIPSIATVFKKEKSGMERNLLQIDEGIKFPLEDFKFIHFEYFKKHAIIKKHGEYADIDDDEILLAKLRNEYQILLAP